MKTKSVTLFFGIRTWKTNLEKILIKNFAKSWVTSQNRLCLLRFGCGKQFPWITYTISYIIIQTTLEINDGNNNSPQSYIGIQACFYTNK